MRYFDDYGNELQETEIDLTLGYLTSGMAIKIDASPIDNETKFAWTDSDYEEAQYYHLYADESAPIFTQEERLAELEAMIEALTGVKA